MRIVEFMEHIVGHLKRPDDIVEVYFGKGVSAATVDNLKTMRPTIADDDSDGMLEFYRDVSDMIDQIGFINFYDIRRVLSKNKMQCVYHFYNDHFHSCVIFKRIDITHGDVEYIVNGVYDMYHSTTSVAIAVSRYLF